MKRFTFRLARLERLRAAEKRQARAVLAQALAEAADRRRERELRDAAFLEARGAELPPESGDDSSAWKRLAQWREALRHAAQAAADREAVAASVAHDAERAYVAAARAHRVLERLRERRYRRWQAGNELEERKFLDEMHLLRRDRERTDEWSRT